MKKSLIGLSILVTLLISGCVTSSEPKPEISTNDKSQKLVIKYKKACALNDVSACNNLGILYAESESVERDYLQSKKYLEKACNLNYGSGCNNLGILYKKGQGVKQSYLIAKKYFEKACDLNDGRGCASLGILYKEGQGVEEDYTISNKYFGKACNLNAKGACTLYNSREKVIGTILLPALQASYY